MQPMPRNKFFFVSIFLLFSLALAVVASTLQTDKATYVPGETVIISGTCSSPSVAVGLRALLGGENIWFDQTTASDSKSYSSQFLPSQKGKYTIIAACQGETGASVDVMVADKTVTPTGSPDGTPSGGSSGGNGGGGGGGGCSPQWQYSEWSYCDANLQQTRTATDKEHCANRKPNQADILRSCEVCEEAWSCGSWSGCSGGVETRDCFDDHACTTTISKPVTTQTCTVSAPPVVQQTAPSKPFFPQIKEKVVSFWDSYIYWIIGIPLAIIILLLIIMLLRVLFKKKLVYNEKEVRDWAKKERAAGTMMDDVKQIIEQYTHWDKVKVEQVVNGLK